MRTSPLPLLVRGLLAGATMVVAAPTLAQGYSNDQRDYPAYQQAGPDYPSEQEDIVVQGRWGQVPDDADSLSQPVSYADLDLSYVEDRRELRHRIEATARYLCNRLGESDTALSVVASCRQSAVRDALNRVGTVEADFVPRGSGWVAPRRWQAPYPAAYDDRRYP